MEKNATLMLEMIQKMGRPVSSAVEVLRNSLPLALDSTAKPFVPLTTDSSPTYRSKPSVHDDDEHSSDASTERSRHATPFLSNGTNDESTSSRQSSYRQSLDSKVTVVPAPKLGSKEKGGSNESSFSVPWDSLDRGDTVPHTARSTNNESPHSASQNAASGHHTDYSSQHDSAMEHHHHEEEKKEDPAPLVAQAVAEAVLEDRLHFPLSINDEVEYVVRMLSPQEEQVIFRENVLHAMQQQIRFAVSAISFDASYTRPHAFLPSDNIKITIVLSQGQIAYWHTALADRLKGIVDNGPDVEAFSNNGHQSDVNDAKEAMHRALLSRLHSVSVVHEMTGFHLVCKIGEVEVEISANNRPELNMIAFMDEINYIVGRDSLFKRSVLLIRGWWQHETASYFNAPVHQFLSEQSLCVMIVAVFNVHWQSILTPLHALYFFLQMYSAYDGKSQVITVQGLVPFVNEISNQPALAHPEAHHLLNIDMLCKYWQLWNVHDPLNAEAPAVAGGSGSKLPSQSKIRLHMLFNSMSKTLQRFERFGFNILHPFQHHNMVSDKLSARRCSLLTDVLQAAFQSLHGHMQHISQVDAAGLPAASHDAVHAFLPNLLHQFAFGHRPDTLNGMLTSVDVEKDWRNAGSAAAQSALHAMGERCEAIYQSIDYCSFVVDNVISESAVLTYCIDLLTVRGPLPTGEVGKLLSEATSIPSLSHKLREKFGGLKKFLERYPSVFVFSNDHPFNPHVLLRQTLSQENLELIDRGIFPIHLISKSARQVQQKNKPNAVKPGAAAGPHGGYGGANASGNRPGAYPTDKALHGVYQQHQQYGNQQSPHHPHHQPHQSHPAYQQQQQPHQQFGAANKYPSAVAGGSGGRYAGYTSQGGQHAPGHMAESQNSFNAPGAGARRGPHGGSYTDIPVHQHAPRPAFGQAGGLSRSNSNNNGYPSDSLMYGADSDRAPISSRRHFAAESSQHQYSQPLGRGAGGFGPSTSSSLFPQTEDSSSNFFDHNSFDVPAGGGAGVRHASSGLLMDDFEMSLSNDLLVVGGGDRSRGGSDPPRRGSGTFGFEPAASTSGKWSNNNGGSW